MKKTNFSVRNLLFIALCASLMAIFSQFSFYIGTIPFSMGIFAVMLTASLLSPLATGAAICTYLFIGAVGFPVFSGFGGGLSALFGPTGGFLLGYIPLGLLYSYSIHNTSTRPLQIVGVCLSLLSCYLLGTLYFSLLTGTPFFASLYVCVIPFVLPDLIKAFSALALGQLLSSRLTKALHTPLP